MMTAGRCADLQSGMVCVSRPCFWSRLAITRGAVAGAMLSVQLLPFGSSAPWPSVALRHLIYPLSPPQFSNPTSGVAESSNVPPDMVVPGLERLPEQGDWTTYLAGSLVCLHEKTATWHMAHGSSCQHVYLTMCVAAFHCASKRLLVCRKVLLLPPHATDLSIPGLGHRHARTDRHHVDAF